MPALSLFCGVKPAHEHKCLEVGNTDISAPISEIIAIAATRSCSSHTYLCLKEQSTHIIMRSTPKGAVHSPPRDLYYKEKSAQMKNTLIIKKAANENNISKAKKEKTPETSKIINNPCKKLNLENQIEELEANLKSIEAEIVEYSHNYEKLNKLFSEKLELQKGIEKLMEEYFN